MNNTYYVIDGAGRAHPVPTVRGKYRILNLPLAMTYPEIKGVTFYIHKVITPDDKQRGKWMVSAYGRRVASADTIDLVSHMASETIKRVLASGEFGPAIAKAREAYVHKTGGEPPL